jgi:tRNA-2-methylthio-N6-dimethylallyladenosine synthase
MGCNSTCSYCIVPSVRGRERSRSAAELVAEARMLAADGVRELTLLGQNVNSWGRDLAVGDRVGFGGLLRLLDEVDGIERIRYTSPHPKDMRDDVIAAHRECPSVCEHVHLPLQSGSTRILKAMRRTYSRERYLALVEKLRAALPHVALTTDIIVGFPGETEADFQETMEVYDAVGYDHAFTFVYSPRRGTDAAAMDDQVSEEVKRDRIERLVERVQAHAQQRNQALVGTVQEVLVEGTSRTDERHLRGRTRQNKTVIFDAADGAAPEGTLQPVRIDAATSMTLRGTHAVRAAA